MEKPLTGAQVRQKYLDFFKSRGHAEAPNVSLVPKDDPTTLFTGSGMQALIPYLMGKPNPLGKRLVNVQKCLRAEDLDEIGDGRHHSFFEMLGNWSLGDYFKKEEIPWTFEFFVDELGIDPHKLYVSVFSGNSAVPKDVESAEIWKDTFSKYGIKADDTEDPSKVGEDDYRIFYYDKKCWWERSGAPIGDPAGPDTEVFYFTGIEHDRKFGEYCHLNCDCGRYIEIGNDVFMQYKKISETGYEPLVQKNVDVGWGLERIVRVVQGKKSDFETDLFYPIIQRIESLSSVKYGEDESSDWVYRIDADHMRAAVFLIADGVVPSNKMQGYVLRRLLRRVIFQSRKLNVPEGFLPRVVNTVIDTYQDYYLNLKDERQKIVSTVAAEESQFNKSLSKGLREMRKTFEKHGKQLTEEDFESFYQSYGVPKELSREICRERR